MYCRTDTVTCYKSIDPIDLYRFGMIGIGANHYVLKYDRINEIRKAMREMFGNV